MLVLHKRKHGINFYTVWFADKLLKKSGIVSYREYMGKQPETKNEEFETLISDLTETEEEIKKHFSKNCRYYVNRAAREEISVEMRYGREITDTEIDEFLAFFDEFWKSKDSALENKERLGQELRAYRNQEALAITCAYVNGSKSVYHTHVVTEQVVRLLHSASLYRLEEDADGKMRNLIGIANRYLHFAEMCFFKSKGKKQYDWGGAGHTEEVQHITEFKESFGGNPAVYYNFEQVNGMAARLFKLAAKIMRK